MLKERIIDFIYEHTELFLQILLVIVIILSYSIIIYFDYSNVEQTTIQVKDKYVKYKISSDKYIVIDSNNNAYQITDLLFIWKFNSTDIYNLLEIGQTYKITTSGYRIRIFSSYPNINKVEK